MQTNVDPYTMVNWCELQNTSKIIIQQTDAIRRQCDFKRTFVQKKYFLETLANVYVSFAILFGQPHIWQHSYGWWRRILNAFQQPEHNFSLKCQLPCHNLFAIKVKYFLEIGHDTIPMILYAVLPIWTISMSSELCDLIPLCQFLFLWRKKGVLVNTKSCLPPESYVWGTLHCFSFIFLPSLSCTPRAKCSGHLINSNSTYRPTNAYGWKVSKNIS